MKEFGVGNLMSGIAAIGMSIAASHAQAAEEAPLRVGPGCEFATIQSAVDAVPEGNSEWVTIEIAPGIYDEKVLVPQTKPFVRLVATEEGKVVMTTCDSVFTAPARGFAECTALKTDADDFEAVGIVFENRASRENVAMGGRGIGQSLAVKTCGDRQVFRRCTFLGHQDTLMTNGPHDKEYGRNYYENCYLEGAVDFIFGGARCLF